MERQASRRESSGRIRGVLGAVLALLVVGAVASAAVTAQDYEIARSDGIRFFRIGTGSTGGTYFPIGGAIANAISNPPGSPDCEHGGSCGVPGLIAAAVATSGSVQNVEGIQSGEFESALCQADIGYLAYTASGIFEGQKPYSDLRTIANLYPEAVHLVVRADSGIRSVADLKGKRVSVDREGSGTKVDATLILKAYGLGLDDIQVRHLSVGSAVDHMTAGDLDAFFIVVGTPAAAIKDLARSIPIRLIPLDGPKAEALRAAYPFFSETSVPAGSYANVPATHTLGVGAQWLVSAKVPEELVYEITKAFWNPASAKIMEDSHPNSALISLKTALDGIAVPLHPGAARFYREQGLLSGEEVIKGLPDRAALGALMAPAGGKS
jgi:TRAP transporter TAXI family solute receptor